MTPKEIAINWIELKDFCHCCRSTYHQRQLAQAYLDLESRLQKLERVAEAARYVSSGPQLRRGGRLILEVHLKAVDEALAELDQP